MIREILLGAGITYLIILAIQIIQRPSIATAAIAAGSLIYGRNGILLVWQS